MSAAPLVGRDADDLNGQPAFAIMLQGEHPLMTSPLARTREVPEIPFTDELQDVAGER
ncbi:MAG: hypothetical protein HOV81_10155 [Kofleriaceae bacterium]|nr:hypothetical protein [Kofleriaceae bacterium]